VLCAYLRGCRCSSFSVRDCKINGSQARKSNSAREERRSRVCDNLHAMDGRNPRVHDLLAHARAGALDRSVCGFGSTAGHAVAATTVRETRAFLVLTAIMELPGHPFSSTKRKFLQLQALFCAGARVGPTRRFAKTIEGTNRC